MQKNYLNGFVAQRFHNYMILKVLIIFVPKLNLFNSDAYISMQQSHTKLALIIYFISQFWLIFQHKKSPKLGIEY